MWLSDWLYFAIFCGQVAQVSLVSLVSLVYQEAKVNLVSQVLHFQDPPDLKVKALLPNSPF